MSPDITVLTSITGGKDHLLDGQLKGGARFKAWATDSSKEWEVLPPPDLFKSARRNSRLPKIMPHLYTDSKYSIWIDGNMRLAQEPEYLVEKYLKNHDFAIFRHPSRDCLYDEALVCAQFSLDDPEKIIEQAKRYEDAGFAKHKGLAECGFILRRHTPAVERFNQTWWAEYCRGSVRDQISFPYAAHKAGLRFLYIEDKFMLQPDGTMKRGDCAIMVQHLTERPEPKI